jgi:hypothetical protein
MTNPKIEKVCEMIAKTRKTILRQQARLRELERQRVALEDAEIVARFREGMMTEDDLAAARRKAGRGIPGSNPEDVAEATVSIQNENDEVI